jgi:hypothetical protein
MSAWLHPSGRPLLGGGAGDCTVVVTGAEFVAAPPLSIATAVSVYVPAATPRHTIEYGALEAVPISDVPAKKSTLTIVPSLSAASAARTMSAGAVAVAPDAGDFSDTVGAALGGVTVSATALDEAVALLSSVATAVSKYVPAGTAGHTIEYGALEVVPISDVPA